MNEKVKQALQKGKEIIALICIKAKALALQGYAKGNELMDRVSFLQKPLHKKIVWCVLGLLALWIVFPTGSSDYRDPEEFVDMMIKEDMTARKKFYTDNGIVKYKILRAEEKEEEGVNVIDCSVQFFPDRNRRYYNRHNEMLDNNPAELVWWDNHMGTAAKKVVDEINALKDKIREIQIYGYRRKSIDEVEKDMLSGGPIERRFLNNKWRPRYHMKELSDGTYFLHSIGYNYTRKCAQDFEDKTVAVFCDEEGNVEDSNQEKAVTECQKGISAFKNIWWKWDKEFVHKGDTNTENWRKENLKYLTDMLNALKKVKPVPRAKLSL